MVWKMKVGRSECGVTRERFLRVLRTLWWRRQARLGTVIVETVIVL